MPRIFLVFFFTSLCFFSEMAAYPAALRGRITDTKNQPLPFTNVYIKGTTTGTTANAEGAYALTLKPGQYEVVFKFIGYKLYFAHVEIDAQDVTLDVILEAEQVQLKEVTISAGEEDPAYAVIRQAIKRRKYYLGQVDAYSCEVYIKGLQKLTKYPKKIFGQELHLGEFVDSTTGIVYLSESVSRFNYKKPDHIKEEMISSKVSGNNRAFSYNQASDLLINFYENTIGLNPLNERGFVSPIAASALFYYRYKLLGTFMEGDEMVNKIEVIPIRKNDPVFTGTIYIMENSWRIHSTELMLTKDAQINFADTLFINQTYLPVTKEVWLPFSNKYVFSFSVFGFHGNGTYVGVNKNYLLDPAFPKNFFNGEVMKVNENANKKDSAYWEEARPVPLTAEESYNYNTRDSIQTIHESKEYLDSLDKHSNTPSWENILLTGYSYYQRYKKQSFRCSPLIENIQFNTVEGAVMKLDMAYNRRKENNRHISAAPMLKYGFANRQGYATLEVSYRLKPEKFFTLSVRGGRNSVQFNEQDPISPLANSVYTLFYNVNYMKLYDKRFFVFDYSRELMNGVQMHLSAEYADRLPMINHSDYILIDNKQKWYTSNNPQQSNNYYNSFSRSRALTTTADLRITFRQEYHTRPNQKIITGSKYPIVFIKYKKGVSHILNSDVNFDFIKIGVEDVMNFKLLGRSNYQISAGKFLNERALAFMDYYHFSGNQIIFSSFILTHFLVLDYYTYSTTSTFAEAHYEHHFGGFIMNKFPLLRNLKLNEIAALHYLSTQKAGQYFEFSAGISRLMFRLDVATAFGNNRKISSGIRIGITL